MVIKVIQRDVSRCISSSIDSASTFLESMALIGYDVTNSPDPNKSLMLIGLLTLHLQNGGLSQSLHLRTSFAHIFLLAGWICFILKQIVDVGGFLPRC